MKASVGIGLIPKRNCSEYFLETVVSSHKYTRTLWCICWISKIPHHCDFLFSLYQGLNRSPSDPEADDKPRCHRASFNCLEWSQTIFKVSIILPKRYTNTAMELLVVILKYWLTDPMSNIRRVIQREEWSTRWLIWYWFIYSQTMHFIRWTMLHTNVNWNIHK